MTCVKLILPHIKIRYSVHWKKPLQPLTNLYSKPVNDLGIHFTVSGFLMKAFFYLSFILLLSACANPDSRINKRKQTDVLTSAVKKPAAEKKIIQPDSPEVSFKAFKTILVQLNNDNLLDTVVLSNALTEKDSFNKISVSIAGFDKQTFVTKYAWTMVDTSFLKENINDISSNDFFVKKTNEQTTLLFFGWVSGAGYRDQFSIINIADNKIQMVFDDLGDIDVAIPVSLTDLDHDGKLDFVFTAFREESPPPTNFKMEGTFESYCPFWVYTVDANCKLNKVLTKNYNEENYVFAGFGYDEGIEVFVPSKGGQKRACKRKKDGKLIWLTPPKTTQTPASI